MRWIWLFTCLWLSAVPAPAAGSPAVRLVMDLTDGTRLIGVPAIDDLKVTTAYASVEVPLAQLNTIELDGTNNYVHARFLNGDVLSGQLLATELTLKTIFGQVQIPITQIRAIRALTATGIGAPLPDGCVLHYTFDSDDGGRGADSSGNGNDAKVIGATYTTEGKFGGAMSFNGDRQALVIGNPIALQVQDFTIMAWIKRGDANKPSANAGDGGVIFGYGHFGDIFGILPTGLLFLSKTDISEVDSQFQIHDDLFHHVAVTKNGSDIVFYLDGVAYPAPPYSPGFEFITDAGVGCRPDSLVWSFLGLIDEVAFFNRPLSSDQVKHIYDSQK